MLSFPLLLNMCNYIEKNVISSQSMHSLSYIYFFSGTQLSKSSLDLYVKEPASLYSFRRKSLGSDFCSVSLKLNN